ncbi:hypothetical protein D9V96_009045 [Zobellia laminariae]|uniref:hypothetical protein n=1 Tax=Zobellia laminariae TaxID=248906 RepID=UPI0012D8B7CB|nr:hypothetical protein [Zobellia laminariae]
MGKVKELESLEKICAYDKNRGSIGIYLKKFLDSNNISFLRNLWVQHRNLGLKSLLLDDNLIAAKQHFYTCGKLDEYLILYHDTILLPSRFTIALLSDNTTLIESYSQLKNSHYELSKKDDGVIFHAMQNVLTDNYEALNDNIKTLDTLSKKNGEWESTFYDCCKLFFIGMTKLEGLKIIDALNQLVDPVFHKKRVLSHTIDLIATPEAGFAKLAWIKGIHIDIKSYLIPYEMLPIIPNETYHIEYEFLKNRLK